MQAQVDKLVALATAEQERIQALQEERLNLEVNLEIPIPLKMGQVRLAATQYHYPVISLYCTSIWRSNWRFQSLQKWARSGLLPLKITTRDDDPRYR